MDKRAELIAAADRLFDRHGFMATSMDQLTDAAGMSSRTLYKHIGSKTELIVAVLAERHQRFMRRMEVESVDALFAALEKWVATEGANGCLFLRAVGETGGDVPEVVDVMADHKAMLGLRIEQIVKTEVPGRHATDLAEQILVLFEGAMTASIYRGLYAVQSARQAATALIAQARRGESPR